MIWDASEYELKARENLAVAQFALDKGGDAAVSRAYYAAFHAAIAAIVRHGSPGLERWSHKEVHARTSRDLVNAKKLLPREHVGTLQQLMGQRHVADYGPGRVSQKRAVALVKLAASFVGALLPKPEENHA